MLIKYSLFLSGANLKLFWAKAITDAPPNARFLHEAKLIEYNLQNLHVCESYYPDGGIYWIEYRIKLDSGAFVRNREFRHGPALEIFYKDGSIRSQFYYHNNTLHRPPELGPAVISYTETGRVIEEYWFYGEKLPEYEARIECKRYHEVEKLFDKRGSHQ